MRSRSSPITENPRKRRTTHPSVGPRRRKRSAAPLLVKAARFARALTALLRDAYEVVRRGPTERPPLTSGASSLAADLRRKIAGS